MCVCGRGGGGGGGCSHLCPWRSTFYLAVCKRHTHAHTHTHTWVRLCDAQMVAGKDLVEMLKPRWHNTHTAAIWGMFYNMDAQSCLHIHYQALCFWLLNKPSGSVRFVCLHVASSVIVCMKEASQGTLMECVVIS